MNASWLSSDNVDRSHTIIRAINTLAIHAKLLLAGVADDERLPEVRAAQAIARDFLERFVALVAEAEQNRVGSTMGIVTGADPRLSHLARTLASRRREWPQQSPLSSRPLFDLQQELWTDLDAVLTPHDLQDQQHHVQLQRLIESLRELRTLLEQNVRGDLAAMLGSI